MASSSYSKRDDLVAIFGYGSLVDHEQVLKLYRELGLEDLGFTLAELTGYRRAFAVAMDNKLDVPGYKYYTTPDGTRPDLNVTFLDVQPKTGSHVNGVIYYVPRVVLAKLDDRERSYSQTRVTSQVRDMAGKPIDGEILVYTGKPERRQLFLDGMASGKSVIHLAYYNDTRAAFYKAGQAFGQIFDATTEIGVPLLELVRHDIPAQPTNPGNRPKRLRGAHPGG